MRRVVVTGIGGVSPLGSCRSHIADSLRNSRSGLTFNPEMRELGFRCQVHAPVRDFDPSGLPVHAAHQMSLVAQYATVASLEALADAGLTASDLQVERTGVVIGSILGGVNEATRVRQIVRDQRRAQRGGATAVVKTMNSSAAASVASALGTQGRTYSISSACASGPEAIGHAYELIAYGLQELVVCGATEEETWLQMGVYYDNWGAMPAAYNDRPSAACRPFDAEHSGFVLAAGAGVVILEEYEAARRRGAGIYAELVGYGSSNDGADMVHPNGQGARRAVLQALAAASRVGVQKIDYLNPHGAGTPLGDAIEVDWIKDLFPVDTPAISSTKGLAGHAMGAAGALEAVYTLIMMREGFIAPTANLEQVAVECQGVPHVREFREAPIRAALSVNPGLGGANGALIFRQI